MVGVVISKSSQLWSSVILGVICHLGNLQTLARGTTLSSAKLLKPAARDVLLGRPAHGVSAGERGMEGATALPPLFSAFPYYRGYQQSAREDCGGGALFFLGPGLLFGSCIQGGLRT